MTSVLTSHRSRLEAGPPLPAASVLTSLRDARREPDLRRHRGLVVQGLGRHRLSAQIKKSQHPVEYLARYIDVIEINTSFYGHIKPEWGKLWCRKAQAVNPSSSSLPSSTKPSPIRRSRWWRARRRRRFAPMTKTSGWPRTGFDSIAGEDMLGAVLAQFPISFKNTNSNRDYLDVVIEKFKHYPLVVEVRHNSWTNEGTLRYFAEKGVAFCNIDQPRLGKAIGPTEHVTSRLAYVRLHGRNYEQWFDSDSGNDRYNYLYTAAGTGEWKTRIDTIAAKARKTFVIANNHFEGKAAVNALQLKHMLTGRTVPVPDTLLRKYWELGEISTQAK